jgi:hypothetical protein
VKSDPLAGESNLRHTNCNAAVRCTFPQQWRGGTGGGDLVDSESEARHRWLQSESVMRRNQRRVGICPSQLLAVAQQTRWWW